MGRRHQHARTTSLLTNPESDNPLLNRATQGLYAPGSTFKLVTSLAMTKYGIRSVGDYYNDNGLGPARRDDLPQRAATSRSDP